MTSIKAAARRVAVAVKPDGIAPELKRRRQWVVWRREVRDGELTKVPYRADGSGRMASVTDLMSWGTFEQAFAAYERGDYDGIGYVFCSACPYVGLDLDGCRCPETGEVEEWAQRIIDRVRDVVHLEVSPSGSGIHIITRGRLRGGAKRGGVEVYGQDRFFCVTGEVL